MEKKLQHKKKQQKQEKTAIFYEKRKQNKKKVICVNIGPIINLQRKKSDSKNPIE